MTPQDLARLHALCFTTPRPYSAGEFKALLSGKGVFLLGDTTGFIIGRAIAEEAEILTLAVHPDHRCHGLATGLVDRFLAEAQARGAATAFLEVSADNITALSLYDRCGFHETHHRRNYYKAPNGRRVDAVMMACQISNTQTFRAPSRRTSPDVSSR